MKYILPIAAVIFSVAFVTFPIVWSDSDFRWGDYEEYERRSTGVSAVVNPVYQEECGSCHMAYPPGLLSAKSWQKIMIGLEDHFGDNAELDAQTHQAISAFLETNSADQSDYRRSKKFMRYVQKDYAPMRISETPYFKHEHDEIPYRVVKGNPQVNSFSHCNACHTRAEQGSFNEHDIHIPGYGRWDD